MVLRRKQVTWCLLAMLVILSVPSTSQACAFLDCLWPWNWCRRPAVAYAPTAGYAAPACGSCAPTTTYMPVTAYRTVYQPTAVTAMQPTSGCGLFGGCCGLFGSSATTTYRPVTSVAYRPALVPYTTYRAVTAMPVAAAPAACNPCATAPTTTYSLGTSYVPAASTCPTNDCGTNVLRPYAATTTVVPAPAVVPAPVPQAVAPGPAAAPGQAPQTYQEQTVPQTFAPQPTQQNGPTNQSMQLYSQPIQNSALQMKPQTETGNGAGYIQPQLIRPNVNPTSQTSVRQATFYRPTSAPAPAVSTQKPRLEVGGWQAARN